MERLSEQNPQCASYRAATHQDEHQVNNNKPDRYADNSLRTHNYHFLFKHIFALLRDSITSIIYTHTYLIVATFIVSENILSDGIVLMFSAEMKSCLCSLKMYL